MDVVLPAEEESCRSSNQPASKSWPSSITSAWKLGPSTPIAPSSAAGKSSKVYNDQYADELVFLNIDRERRSIEPLLETLAAASEVCFMALAMGGGITTIDDARRLILGGADKVVVNSGCYARPNAPAPDRGRSAARR